MVSDRRCGSWDMDGRSGEMGANLCSERKNDVTCQCISYAVAFGVFCLVEGTTGRMR